MEKNPLHDTCWDTHSLELLLLLPRRQMLVPLWKAERLKIVVAMGMAGKERYISRGPL